MNIKEILNNLLEWDEEENIPVIDGVCVYDKEELKENVGEVVRIICREQKEKFEKEIDKLPTEKAFDLRGKEWIEGKDWAVSHMKTKFKEILKNYD